MKRAQIEMIGLVLVVVLLLLGALFYLRFGILDKENKREASTLKGTQAFHLTNALVKVRFCDTSLEDVLIQCEEEPALAFCGRENACAFLEQEIPKIVDPLLHKNVGVRYTFFAQKGEEAFFRLQDTFGGCITGVNSPAYSFKGRRYKVFFKLCSLE